MKVKNKRIFREIIIGIMIVLFVGIGFSLNYNLLTSVKVEEEEVMIDEKEKNFLSYIRDTKDLDRVAFEKEYLEKLEELEKSSKSKPINYDIGKVNYFLAANSFENGDYDKATTYFKKAIEIFDGSTYYYYLLRAHSNIMNIYFIQGDDISALKHGTEIYTILNNSSIKAIPHKEQVTMKINVLSGIVTTASAFEMEGVGEKFYNELVTITRENPDIKDNLNIYAKYKYNLDKGNYEEAKKYALEYADFFKDADEVDYGSAHIYLLEALVNKKEFDNIDEIFNIVEKAYKELDFPLYYATLDKMKGIYYEGIEDYSTAVDYYEKAIDTYEEIGSMEQCTLVNKRIIGLHDKIKLDIDKYLERQSEYSKEYDYTKKVGKLSDSLIELSFKKVEEENNRIKEEAKIAEKINNISKKINVVYILIIILLVVITRMLKVEITERKEKEKELENMVKTDYLTKALSRQYTINEINKKIKSEEEFFLILFDLDNFKKMNDKYGHYFGDEVLVKVVETVKKTIGDNGFIGRFGGEEFIIVLNNKINSENIDIEIRNDIKNIKLSNEDVKVSISGGMIRRTTELVDDIIQEADELLYEAKESGKDRIIKRL